MNPFVVAQAATNRRTFLRRAVWLAAGLCVLYAVLLVAAPYGRLAKNLVGNGFDTTIELVVVVACFYRAATVRAGRAAWIAFGVGAFAWLVGDTYWTALYSGASSVPYPSVADAFYILLYPAFFIGLLLLARDQMVAPRRSIWLGGVIAAFSLAALEAALIFDAVGSGAAGGSGAVATNLVYLAADVFLLTVVFSVWALADWRPNATWRLLGLSVVVLAIGDALFLYKAANGTYVAGGWIDIFWPVAFLLLAIAATRPTVPVTGRSTVGNGMFTPTGVFVALALSLLVYDHFTRIGIVALGFAIVAIAAAIVQLGIMLHENSALLRRARIDAFTDPTTGLPNRRRLLLDLERVCEAAAPDTPAAFVMYDLNEFKSFNDRFGHPAGDALLRRLGLRLARIVDRYGTAYRLGDDEFCVLVFAEPSRLDDVLDDARATLVEHGPSYNITAAAGAVSIPQDGADPSAVLRLADQRMYADKQQQKSRFGDAVDDPLGLLGNAFGIKTEPAEAGNAA